jgi:hypothetical protein
MTTTLPGAPAETSAPRPDGLPAQAAMRHEDVAAGVTLADLPARDLDPHELLELVTSIARDPSLWSEHVAFSDEQRHYVSLHRDAHVDVWVLCWTPASDTGWHDHDISCGAVAVAQGALVEHNLTVGVPLAHTDVEEGLAYSFGAEHIHRLTGRDAGSVSIHAYSPPLWRMGQYVLTPTGVLRRTSVSYADELRPLDDVV